MRPSLFRIACFGLLLAAIAGCRAQGRVAGASRAKPLETIELRWEELPAAPARVSRAAPISLTAFDGTGIELVTLSARGAVEGPLAFTELKLIFENPSPRVLEGTFSVTLPPTASVHRFAMRIGGVLQEGEIVERQKAEQTFEAFLHRRVDPALLEQQPGNQFRARVFPIAPKEQKEIVLAYSEILEKSDEPYRLYLSGLPTLDELEISVSVAGAEGGYRLFHLRRELATPDRDFVLPVGSPALARAGNFAVARVKTPNATKPDPIAELTIAFDTSASRAAHLPHHVRELGQLVNGLARRGNPSVRIVAFDQDTHEVWRGRASEFREPHVSTIVARGAGGATDLGHALATLRGQRAKRLLLLSDSIFTAGGSALPDLQRQARAAGIERFDVALAGTTRDEKAAKRVAAAGLRTGALLDAALGSERAFDRLLSRGASPLRIRVPGSSFSFPEQLSAAAAGDEAVVFAELTGEGPLEIVLNETRHTLPSSVAASQALVERALARARIEKLMRDHEAASDEAIRNRIQRRVVSLSRKHQVLSAFTSLLVLESEEDYARFGIDRTAPHEFMAVGESGGVEIVGRVREALPPDGRGGVSGALPVSGGGGDQDRDQIPDAVDRCPFEPETYNGIDDKDGCPDKGKVLIESNEIIILELIQFELGTATIHAASQPIIDEIVATLKGHPGFRLLEIAGYTDSQGNALHNQRLSERRAQAVYRALVRGGIAPARLVARGYGDRCPRHENTTPAGRERNRRVEFRILETDQGPTGVGTCADRPHPRPPPPALKPAAAQRRVREWVDVPLRSREADGQGLPARPSAVEGELARVRGLLEKGRADEALRAATVYRDQKPGDELAWVALGDCHLEKGEYRAAARAYGSLIDLAGDSAPKRRAAAGLLESVERRTQANDAKLAASMLALAVDAYQKALERRSDHPSSYELYAYALAKQNKLEDAFDVLVRGTNQHFEQRFAGAKSLLAADLGLMAAVWAAREPHLKERIEGQLRAQGVALRTAPSLRFILSWESDTSDVNLHVMVGDRRLSSERNGNNVRDGYGPEEIAFSDTTNLPHRIGVTFDRRGFQGYALGKVTVVHHDGAGQLSFDDRPFVLMKEHGYADLGEFRVPAIRHQVGYTRKP